MYDSSVLRIGFDVKLELTIVLARLLELLLVWIAAVGETWSILRHHLLLS